MKRCAARKSPSRKRCAVAAIAMGILANGTTASIFPTPRKARASIDRKSTRLNSSHSQISYAVFCLNPTGSVLYTLSLHDALPILLTGRYSLRTGVRGVTRGDETMRSEEVTIAEALRGGGYRNGYFGKWHNGEHFPYTPQGQGFDRSEEHTSELQSQSNLVCRLLLESDGLRVVHSFPTRRSSDLVDGALLAPHRSAGRHTRR